MKTTRVVLIAVGAVAVAALAKKWFTPGDVYDATASPAAVESLAPSTGDWRKRSNPGGLRRSMISPNVTTLLMTGWPARL